MIANTHHYKNLIPMKNSIFLILVLLAIFNYNAANSNNEETNSILSSLKGSTDVFCTPDLYTLTKNLADEFCTQNPNLNIKVIIVKESSIAEILNTGKYLGFISYTNEYQNTLDNEMLLKIVVGRNVVIPIINSKNPFINEIFQKGISPAKLAQIFEDSEIRNWGTLLNNNINIPINFYMIYDKSIISGLAKFLNINQFSIEGTHVENSDELMSLIQNDPYSIGFCKMIHALDLSTHRIVENINLLPLDRNSNGEIEYFERIYDDLNSFSRGVWIGKYPKSLSNNIYSISPVNPTNKIQKEFMKWIITDGQHILNSSGYSELAFGERQRKLDKLLYNDIETKTSQGDYAITKLVTIISISFIILGFIIILVIRYFKNKQTLVVDPTPKDYQIFNENSIRVPRGLYFDKTHTWAFMEKNGNVRVGIDDFLQHVTGPLTQIKLKNTGMKFKKGDSILSIIQNGKQLQINAPISGTILSQNKALSSKSSILNSAPYSDGWIYLIEPSKWLKEIQFLIMEKKYKEWLKNEFSRIKDFLAVSLKSKSVGYTHSVFQEGGELKDNILADFGPEVWEDFQTDFLDTSK